MAYLLDANVFIQAKNLHYGLDFCPAFWDWLVQSNNAGLVLSIERGEDEITGIADELSAWAEARGSDFFVRPDAAIVPALGQVSTWAPTRLMSRPLSVRFYRSLTSTLLRTLSRMDTPS